MPSNWHSTVFFGGWLKKNKRNRKAYRAFLVVGSFFIVLSTAFSINGVLNYVFPLNPILAIVSSVVLFVEALLVWRFSIREGKKPESRPITADT